MLYGGDVLPTTKSRATNMKCPSIEPNQRVVLENPRSYSTEVAGKAVKYAYFPKVEQHPDIAKERKKNIRGSHCLVTLQ
jgi:hypothetical protein